MEAFSQLENEFNAILVLTASEDLLSDFVTANLAAQMHGGLSKIEVLDTRQIGPGLGMLANLAAKRASAGANLQEVSEYVRSVIPNIFTVIYPDYLPSAETEKNKQHNSESTPQQIYSLEEGIFTPYKKVRTQRHLLENLQEFLEEFDRPQQLIYFHGKSAGLHARPLREASTELFSGLHFIDIEMNTTLSALFGEHTVGLTILEIPITGGL